jgi:hypothetical protein
MTPGGAMAHSLPPARALTIGGRGIIYHNKLANDFISFFGEELLTLMQSTVEYHNHSCWLKKIVRKHRAAFHPVRHLLMMLFLGESVNSIMQHKNKKYLPFGEGGYPPV